MTGRLALTIWPVGAVLAGSLPAGSGWQLDQNSSIYSSAYAACSSAVAVPPGYIDATTVGPYATTWSSNRYYCHGKSGQAGQVSSIGFTFQVMRCLSGNCLTWLGSAAHCVENCSVGQSWSCQKHQCVTVITTEPTPGSCGVPATGIEACTPCEDC